MTDNQIDKVLTALNYLGSRTVGRQMTGVETKAEQIESEAIKNAIAAIKHLRFKLQERGEQLDDAIAENTKVSEQRDHFEKLLQAESDKNIELGLGIDA